MAENKRIGVLYDGSYYTFRWLKALRWAKSDFRDLGVDIHFLGPLQYMPLKRNRVPSAQTLNIGRVDALFIAHHHSHAVGIGAWPSSKLASVLDDLRTACDTLVWLDTADSTGTCRFDVMPHVDLYFKKQVLRDRERYLQPIWGGRLHCEYYHSKYRVDDDEVSRQHFETLTRDDLDKIRISWNVGLGDLFAPNKYVSYVSAGMRNPKTRPPSLNRTMDVHFRGSAWSSAAGWQRSKARELLKLRRDLSYPDPDSTVSYQEYIREMRASRVVVSPFGWGEICTRDFESMASGALLVKPSVDHLETFPNWFRPNNTYVAIDWDFANFNEKLDFALHDEDGRRDVANEAQKMFRFFRMGNSGRMAFARHVVGNLGWS